MQLQTGYLHIEHGGRFAHGQRAVTDLVHSALHVTVQDIESQTGHHLVLHVVQDLHVTRFWVLNGCLQHLKK